MKYLKTGIQLLTRPISLRTNLDKQTRELGLEFRVGKDVEFCPLSAEKLDISRSHDHTFLPPCNTLLDPFAKSQVPKVIFVKCREYDIFVLQA